LEKASISARHKGWCSRSLYFAKWLCFLNGNQSLNEVTTENTFWDQRFDKVDGSDCKVLGGQMMADCRQDFKAGSMCASPAKKGNYSN
jgi:hypothetical protein